MYHAWFQKQIKGKDWMPIAVSDHAVSYCAFRPVIHVSTYIVHVDIPWSDFSLHLRPGRCRRADMALDELLVACISPSSCRALGIAGGSGPRPHSQSPSKGCGRGRSPDTQGQRRDEPDESLVAVASSRGDSSLISSRSPNRP